MHIGFSCICDHPLKHKKACNICACAYIKSICRIYYLLDSLGGWGTVLEGSTRWISGCVDCCAFSGVWGVLMRGGTSGVCSFCISSALVEEGLEDKEVQHMSTVVWRAGDESSDSMVIWDQGNIPQRQLILYILCWEESPSTFQTKKENSRCRQQSYVELSKSRMKKNKKTESFCLHFW